MRDALGRVGSVLVLGGSSDIGIAATAALAREGAHRFVLAARDPSATEPVVERLRSLGATAVETRAFDADDLIAHEGFVENVFHASDIDVALLSFGVLPDQLAAEKDPSLAAAVATTNYVGAISVLTCLAKRMDEQGHGAIVVMSSVAGERGRRSNYLYGTSKAGLDVFCQGLGDRLRDRGVRVLIVRPGFVMSKMTRGLRPTPLSTTPGRVADAIVRGLQGEAAIVWVPPALRFVMSALRHLPRSIFRELPI